MARGLKLPPGAIVVVDRGYVDHAWLDALTAAGVFFVIRAKEGGVTLVDGRVSPPKGNILADETVLLPGSGADRDPGRLVRRVAVWDATTGRRLVLLTNQFRLATTTIAALYKGRWQIELFFKALKQNFKIKTFVGTSPDAVRIQIWTALIAILLLKYLQLRSRLGWSLSNLVALLRLNLFVHRDPWEWPDQPFQPPPEPTGYRQTSFAFG